MRRWFFVLFCLTSFGVGAYLWTFENRGLAPLTLPTASEASARSTPLQVASSAMLEVAGDRITNDDVEWEYQVATSDVSDKASLTPIPDLGARYDVEMQPFRRAILSHIIERKVLYAYVKQDKDFDLGDPGRYAACLADWQASVKANVRAVQISGGRERLKARLCEREVLKQYLAERVFPKIRVEDGEVVEYFKNHASEFAEAERVIIRHILLPSEKAAKTVRQQVDAGNFAEMARNRSIAPEAASGGKLGPFSQTGMPSVFEVAFHMHKGQISDVVKSPYGFHIIMLVDKLPKREMSLDEARARIGAILKRKREDDVYKQLVEKALAAVTVKVPG